MERRRQVLIADDDDVMRELLVLNLEAQGHAVAAAADGREAFDLARWITPDLVILDVMMPDVDGITVLQQLRDDPDLCELPVVLLTARATDADVWEGWRSGADYYITKPFEMAELLRFVDHLFAESA